MTRLEPAAGTAGSASTRREFAVVVLLCLGASALALWASTRTWSVRVLDRPSPLPPVREVLSGRELSAISVALSVVGVAGALALLATRRVGRVLVAILLFLAGGGVAAGAGQVLLRNQEVTARQWPLLCIVAGLVMASCGFSALARGRRWPVMGAKYDAPSPQTSQTSSMGAGSMETSSMGAGSMGAGQLAEPGAVTDSAVMWNALDRGEDPTGG